MQHRESSLYTSSIDRRHPSPLSQPQGLDKYPFPTAKRPCHTTTPFLPPAQEREQYLVALNPPPFGSGHVPHTWLHPRGQLHPHPTSVCSTLVHHHTTQLGLMVPVTPLDRPVHTNSGKYLHHITHQTVPTSDQSGRGRPELYRVDNIPDRVCGYHEAYDVTPHPPPGLAAWDSPRGEEDFGSRSYAFAVCSMAKNDNGFEYAFSQ